MVLHFAADGGLAFLNVACPVNGVVAYGGNAAGTKIDAVINGGQMLVMCHFRTHLESQIGGITIYDLVIFPDQLRGHRHIVDIGGSDFYRVDIARSSVRAHMVFHPKPLRVPFLGRVHFRVSFLIHVLGETGGVNDGGVYNRSSLHDMPACRRHPVDRVKKQLVQPNVIKLSAEKTPPANPSRYGRRCFLLKYLSFPHHGVEYVEYNCVVQPFQRCQLACIQNAVF